MTYDIYLSGLIHVSRCVLYRAAKDALLFVELARQGNTEELVWRTAEATQVVVNTGPYQLPVVEIAGAIDKALDVSFVELSTLDDGINRFQDVRQVKLQRACDDEAGDGGRCHAVGWILCVVGES